MKDLYLSIAVLCFLVALIIYYTNKNIQVLRELRHIWKEYKKSQEEIKKLMEDNETN